jgi:methylated-DNA-[protein]-cysteine S-methyltransferase
LTAAWTHLPSPVGRLLLAASDDALLAVLWENDRPGRVRLASGAEAPDHPVLRETAAQLDAYFAGRLRHFDLPLDFSLGTPFQRRVWQALCAIPFGDTCSYAALARSIDAPQGAVRAVGAANGRNPISIVAPCHRVIGAAGALTGFAGGLKAKAFLLDLERAAIHDRTTTLL